MILNISNHEFTVIERDVFYFALPNYPNISVYELEDILAFIKYEKMYGRQTEIVCENATILAAVNNAISHPETVKKALLPDDDGLTKFVYHATSIDATKKILSGGRLLSAAKVSGKSGTELAYEKRNSPWNDPPDYFEYIMFGWGDSPIGDYVVMSEKPDSDFTPGVRFYFRWTDLIQHPGHVFDGYHPVKVKDEIILSNYLYACIVPEQYRIELDSYILPELAPKVYYLPQNELGITDWNDMVYDFITKK